MTRYLLFAAALVGCIDQPDPPTTPIASAITSTAPESVTIGNTGDLDVHAAATPFAIPRGEGAVEIIGIGIAANDHVYTWFADNTVSQGTSQDLGVYAAPMPFVLPTDRKASTIVGMAIGASDHVFSWFTDRKACEGTSTDLCRYAGPFDYVTPQAPSEILGIDISDTGAVYTWFRDGHNAIGSVTNLGIAAFTYSLSANQKPLHVVDMAFAGDGRVYTWYQDLETGPAWVDLANAVDPIIVKALHDSTGGQQPAGDPRPVEPIAGLTVAVSKNGRMVLNRGYGYANVDLQTPRRETDRSHLGSVSKIITTLGVVHFAEASDSFDLTTPVYGAKGVLKERAYLDAQVLGQKRHRPVVGFAIGPNDRVYAWYQNGTYSSGTTQHLDETTAPAPYKLAAGKTSDDLLGIAIASTGTAYAWYIDGTWSAGSPSDLGQLVGTTPTAMPVSTISVLAIGIRKSDDHVFAWYRDNTYSEGTILNFSLYRGPTPWEPATGYSPYDLLDADFNAAGRVYFRYLDEAASAGTPADADATLARYDSHAAVTTVSPDWLTWYAQMTVSHLLNYSAGFWGSGEVAGTAEYFGGIDPSTVTYGQINQHVIGTRRLRYEPGTKSEYSNHSLGLAGYVLERASGETYEAYIRNHILRAVFKLDDIVPNGTVTDHLASPHRYDSAGHLVPFTDDPVEPVKLAAGGWAATAGDMVRLMLATDRNPNHPDLVSTPSLIAMEAQPYAARGYALGWIRGSDGTVSKDGVSGDVKAFIIKYASGPRAGITVALCGNGGGSVDTLKALAGQIATEAAGQDISSTYDLF